MDYLENSSMLMWCPSVHFSRKNHLLNKGPIWKHGWREVFSPLEPYKTLIHYAFLNTLIILTIGEMNQQVHALSRAFTIISGNFQQIPTTDGKWDGNCPTPKKYKCLVKRISITAYLQEPFRLPGWPMSPQYASNVGLRMKLSTISCHYPKEFKKPY